MISAELHADLGQRQVRHVVDEVHRHLSCLDDGRALGLAADDRLIHIEVAAAFGDDGRSGGDKLVVLLENILERTHDGGFVQISALKIAIGEDFIDGALQLTDVGGDILGDELREIVIQHRTLLRCLVLHDGKAGLKVGGLHVLHDAPLEAGLQTVAELSHL